MKNLITLLLLTLVSISILQAQQADNTITIGQSGENSIQSKDGNLSLTIAGLNFKFSGDKDKAETTDADQQDRTRFTFGAIGSSEIDHIALIELGTNVLANASYDIYSPEEAVMMPFSNRKSIYWALNILTMNVALNKKRSLGFEMGFGFAMENYSFAGNYSMKYHEGKMQPIVLDGNIKKSKLYTSYLHIPAVINWNFKQKFFIAAGLNIDILISSQTRYRESKTTTFIYGQTTLNPIQIGATARIGWGKLYGFVNYSFMEMFKKGTGPGGNRLSAGIGLFF